jgi:RNA 3'-terminal phosphate cyclase-like protein
VSLVAETTTGCLLSVDATVSYPSVDEMNEDSERPELMSPEDLGVQAASMLLEEVAQGGVVDSTHQVWPSVQVFLVQVFCLCNTEV